MPGTITFKPIEARLTRDTDWFGAMDPYCTFLIGKEKVHNQVCKSGGKQPHWEDAVTMDTHGESTCLMQLRDKDKILPDEIIGTVDIDLQEIESQGHVARWYPVIHKSKVAGEILIDTTFTPVVTKVDPIIPIEPIVPKEPVVVTEVIESKPIVITEVIEPKPIVVTEIIEPKPVVQNTEAVSTVTSESINPGYECRTTTTVIEESAPVAQSKSSLKSDYYKDTSFGNNNMGMTENQTTTTFSYGTSQLGTISSQNQDYQGTSTTLGTNLTDNQQSGTQSFNQGKPGMLERGKNYIEGKMASKNNASGMTSSNYGDQGLGAQTSDYQSKPNALERGINKIEDKLTGRHLANDDGSTGPDFHRESYYNNNQNLQQGENLTMNKGNQAPGLYDSSLNPNLYGTNSPVMTTPDTSAKNPGVMEKTTDFLEKHVTGTYPTPGTTSGGQSLGSAGVRDLPGSQ